MHNHHLPKITTKQTQNLRDQYPNLSHLEAGSIPEWLQERKDQLFAIAREAENAADLTRVLGLLTGGVGIVCYAVNPFMVIGGMIGGAAWLWFVVEHYARTREIAPLPFVRGNFIDALSRAGDYEARSSYEADHLAGTIKFLERTEAEEYVFLYAQFESIVQYLNNVEPGKRFYAYRWMYGWFSKLKGRQLPTYESMVDHLQHVTIDSRINYEEVQAIAQTTRNTPVVDSKQFSSPTVDVRQLQDAPTKVQQINFNPTTLTSLPLDKRATLLIDALIKDGFKIDEMMASQVIAVCGTQRGGKGTLAALLTTLSKALDPHINTHYFTAGVDVYPCACNLHSALTYSGKDADTADTLVAQALLLFLKSLESCEPYSHKNLLLVIDEAMRLLSLLEESDRTWAIQFILSRFAKCGGTLIIVLHGSNLTSVVGKATIGLADTFKQSVSFIGCMAKSVSAGGLRKINVASGEYFKANPNDFGTSVAGGELGKIPEWLKIQNHPANGQPDPVRSLLTFFPELIQQHHVDQKQQLENLLKLETVEHGASGEKEEEGFDFYNAIEAVRNLSVKNRDWIKIGDARANNKSLRRLTRDAEDVRLVLSFLQKNGEVEIRDNEYFRVVK
ncbi:hypothetical protein IQ278_11965 [Tolypothrix sp. LEGE 11397]|uniref:hypothetical protein n=1 Tax=Tolypothrix sp. LEGE 11397 TaxID=2777971 RepID=UPI00187F8CBF|nr:hypothetical protein [Tolypothrix sp. LEGE 11397]MBE9082829.1 hypothetical protein [Tolypothrix sp. LEGE 11397]